MLARGWFLALLLSASVACGAPRFGTGQIHESQTITEEEIAATQATSAYDAIRKLRANFLSYRGETALSTSRSSPYPTVYVDGQQFGPISSLSTIPASQIAFIRLYRAWEATTEFGTGHMSGVIAIRTKQGQF